MSETVAFLSEICYYLNETRKKIMSVLEIKNLSHRYDDKVLFHNADLQINNGEHVGIVGLNGAGKSTFINILAGEVLQDEGEVRWQNGIKKSYLDQHAELDKTLTVMEYLKSSFTDLFAMNDRMESLYAEMGNVSDPNKLDEMIRKATNLTDRLTDAGFFELEANIKRIANGLGVMNFGYDTVIGTLSGGQRAKLMLAKLLLDAPDVMMLDEPTNFLDIEHIAWLTDFLNASPKTVLVISHDADFLDRVCRFTVNIENGQIKKYAANYSGFLSQREQNAKQYENDYNRQQREIEKMEDYIARNKVRAATAGMANARKKQLAKIQVLQKPTVIHDAVFTFPCEELNTKELLVVEGCTIGYGKPLLPPFSFQLGGTDKIWIRGTNGVGKTTLIKTLLRKIPSLGGSFRFHPAIRIGYLEQELDFADAEFNAMAYYNRFYPREGTKETRNALAKVGLKGDLATNPVCELSGGEQVRLKLCVLMQQTTNLLILDEPTNHLDVRAKDALKKALLDYAGGLILVTHEKPFAEGLCNVVLDVKES